MALSFFFASLSFAPVSFLLSLFFIFAKPLFRFHLYTFTYIHLSFFTTVSSLPRLPTSALHLRIVHHPQFTVHPPSPLQLALPLHIPPVFCFRSDTLLSSDPVFRVLLLSYIVRAFFLFILFFSHQHQKSTFIHCFFLFRVFPFSFFSVICLCRSLPANIHISIVCLLLFISPFCHSPIHIVLTLGTHPFLKRFTLPNSIQQKIETHPEYLFLDTRIQLTSAPLFSHPTPQTSNHTRKRNSCPSRTMNFSTLVLSDHFVGPSQEEYFHADFDDYQNTIDLHYYHSNYYPVYSEGLASLRKGNSSYRHTDPRNGTAQTQGGLIIEDSLNLSVMALEEARQYEWRRSDQAMSSPSSTMTSLAYPLASTSVTASASHVNIDENSVGVRGKAQAQHQHLQQYLQQQQHCQQGSNIPLLLSSSLSSPLYQPSHPLAPPQVTFNAGTESTSPPSVPTILGEQAVAGSSPAPASSPTVAMDYMLSTANQGYMFVPPPSSHSHFQPDHSSYEAHQQQHHHEHEQEQLSVSLHGNRSVPLYLPVSVPTGFQGYNQQGMSALTSAEQSSSFLFSCPFLVHSLAAQQHHSIPFHLPYASSSSSSYLPSIHPSIDPDS